MLAPSGRGSYGIARAWVSRERRLENHLCLGRVDEPSADGRVAAVGVAHAHDATLLVQQREDRDAVELLCDLLRSQRSRRYRGRRRRCSVVSAAAQVEHEGLVPWPRAQLQRGRGARQREANE